MTVTVTVLPRRTLKPQMTVPADQEREGATTLVGCWMVFCQRFPLPWKLLICVSYMFEIVFSNLENHKAAINKWNSGENPFISVMNTFTSVY